MIPFGELRRTMAIRRASIQTIVSMFRETAFPTGRCADPTQQFFHYLTFEFDAESSSVLHDKILSPVSRHALSCRLP
jgi:hypothetical protein